MIGLVRTPYPEKFGIPRQPGLSPSATATLELLPEFRQPGVFEGLEGCSHVWILFWFHHQAQEWSPKVRPPRLGGNEKFGVFATRSPFRPNPLGLSAVRLLEVREFDLVLAGADLLDGTPVLDIKPYVPYSDCLPEATFELAGESPERLQVTLTPAVEQALAGHPGLRELIIETLSLDPRPAYHQDSREYGTALAGHNVRWKVEGGTVTVFGVALL